MLNFYLKKKFLPFNLFHQKQWTLDFLPEYQIIQQKPPANIGHLLSWIICSLLLFFLLWALIFKVDIIVTGAGQLKSQQGSSLIQTAVFGQIDSIHVNNGDKVQQGDLLISLQDTSLQAKLTMLQQMIIDIEIDIAKLNALATDDPESNFILPKNLPIKKEVEARNRLRASLYYYQTQIEALKSTDPNNPRSQILDYSQRVKQFKAEYAQKRTTNLTQLNQKYAELIATRIDTQEKIAKTQIKSPITGQIQELYLNTVGAVIEPGQKLLVIVPDHNPVIANVMISSRDIGFIKKDQPVNVKVDSFPYTRYGTLSAKVTHIAKDAVVDEKAGLLFPITITLLENKNAYQKVALKAGMQVSAEITTGKRRLISYLLSPLQEYQNESFRER